MNRLGNRLLALAGCVLAGLMLYIVIGDGARSGVWSPLWTAREAAEVAVFFPDRSQWCAFRLAIDSSAARTGTRVVEDADNAVWVETPAHARRVRFAWHDVRGLRETKDEVRRLTGQGRPPVAVVGSGNTVLTAALAEALNDSAAAGDDDGPALLVPWATTVLAERPGPGSSPVAFLDLYPGRTFRFCPNNQDQADLVSRCVVDHTPGRALGRAEIVVDRYDPYSQDLADSFHRVLERRFKNAVLSERADRLALPGLLGPLPGLPSPSEDALAAEICREAGRLGKGQVLWVVLPLQEEPALRMLVALQRHAGALRGAPAIPLQVVCGDGIGPAALFRLAGHCPLPVWCFSSASPPAAGHAPDPVLATDSQVLAEIVTAVVRCLDLPRGQTPTGAGFRRALAALRLPADSPGAFGRSLSFTPSGERRGDDLGQILRINPGSSRVTALVREPSGGWSETVLEPPDTVAIWP